MKAVNKSYTQDILPQTSTKDIITLKLMQQFFNKKNILSLMAIAVLIWLVTLGYKDMKEKKAGESSEKFLSAYNNTNCTAENTYTVFSKAFEDWYKVCKLDLSNQKLDMIPEPVYSITNIKSLDLSYNTITDISKIGAFQKLLSLDISHNKIAKIPNSLTSIESLGEINASYNEADKLFDDAFLDPSYGLTNLKRLNLSHNKFKTLPPVITSMPNLTNLNLAGNNILVNNTFVSTISGLKNLILLTISKESAKGSDKQIEAIKTSLPDLKVVTE